MTPPRRPVEEDDLHARIDGQLPHERVEEVDAYLAVHPEEEERFSQYAQPILDYATTYAEAVRRVIAPYRRAVEPQSCAAPGRS